MDNKVARSQEHWCLITICPVTMTKPRRVKLVESDTNRTTYVVPERLDLSFNRQAVYAMCKVFEADYQGLLHIKRVSDEKYIIGMNSMICEQKRTLCFEGQTYCVM